MHIGALSTEKLQAELVMNNAAQRERFTFFSLIGETRYSFARVHFMVWKSFLVVLLLGSHLSASGEEAWDLIECYIEFDESMHRGYPDDIYEKSLKEKPQCDYLPSLKDLYEGGNFLTKIGKEPIHAIPKIIHQIWLGSPLPERYKKIQEEWKRFHPEWEYRLWTDKDIESFQLINQQAFDQAKNYGEKSNIFRYEILDRFGGLYVDTDFICLRPFDLIHDFYEFYAGIATVDRITLINNGLIASVPGHPILKQCIQNLNKRDYGYEQFGRNGTLFFGYIVMEVCMKNEGITQENILLLPPTYFYPYSKRDVSRDPESYLVESSFAVHLWDSSWCSKPQL